jgi:hypothetical protein
MRLVISSKAVKKKNQFFDSLIKKSVEHGDTVDYKQNRQWQWVFSYPYGISSLVSRF